jgi:hypothetical protein
MPKFLLNVLVYTIAHYLAIKRNALLTCTGSISKIYSCWTPEISALGRLREEDFEFKAKLGYRESSTPTRATY